MTDAPTVALLGRTGVTMDAVRQHLAGGACVTRAVVPGVTDAIVIIEPSPEEWLDLRQLDTPVVAVIDDDRDDVVLDTLAAGANAVVETTDHPDQLANALRLVCRGEVLLSRQLAQIVLLRLRVQTPVVPAPGVELTMREEQILRSIAAGDGVKQTARALGIQVKTVQNLQSRLFRKLGASNRVHCITRAHELHLLS